MYSTTALEYCRQVLRTVYVHIDWAISFLLIIILWPNIWRTRINLHNNPELHIDMNLVRTEILRRRLLARIPSVSYIDIVY